MAGDKLKQPLKKKKHYETGSKKTAPIVMWLYVFDLLHISLQIGVDVDYFTRVHSTSWPHMCGTMWINGGVVFSSDERGRKGGERLAGNHPPCCYDHTEAPTQQNPGDAVKPRCVSRP